MLFFTKVERLSYVTVSDLFYSVGLKANPVLKDINLKIEQGESLAIVGKSGCGKSTLLNLMAGLTNPTRGKITVNGKLVNGPNPKLNLMFQNPLLFPWLNVLENVAFGLQIQKRPSTEVIALSKEALALVGLAGKEGSSITALSGGESQRVALARSISLRPEVLFLDEPFSCLDPFTKKKLQTDIQKIVLERKMTIVLVTHDMLEAAVMSHRAIILGGTPGCIVGEVNLSGPYEAGEGGMTDQEKRDALLSAFSKCVAS